LFRKICFLSSLSLYIGLAIIFPNAAIISRKLAIILFLNGEIFLGGDYVLHCGDYFPQCGDYLPEVGDYSLSE